MCTSGQYPQTLTGYILISFLAPPFIFSHALSVSSASKAVSSALDGASISESGISVNSGVLGTSGTGSGSSLSSASMNSLFVGNSGKSAPAWMQSSTTAGILGIENLSSWGIRLPRRSKRWKASTGTNISSMNAFPVGLYMIWMGARHVQRGFRYTTCKVIAKHCYWNIFNQEFHYQTLEHKGTAFKHLNNKLSSTRLKKLNLISIQVMKMFVQICTTKLDSSWVRSTWPSCTPSANNSNNHLVIRKLLIIKFLFKPIIILKT